MGLVTTIRCDGHGCSAEKRVANHWWVVSMQMSNDGVPVLMVTPLKDKDSLDPIQSSLYLCGEECVLKTVSKFMTPHGDPLRMTEMG